VSGLCVCARLQGTQSPHLTLIAEFGGSMNRIALRVNVALGFTAWLSLGVAYNSHAAVLAHAEVGRGTTCVVSGAGAPSCYGTSAGDVSPAGVHTVAVTPTGIGPITSIALSIFNNFVCVINSDKAVWCWSSDGIRVPFRLQVADVPFLNVTDVSVGASGAIAGDQDACTVLENSTVACWQFEASGFKALNSTPVRGLDGQPISAVTQVSVGYGFACAVTSNNAVLCWGLNNSGQLGRGFVTPNYSPFPAVPITGLTATLVSAGLNHACAVTTDGMVKCWGSDEYGQLGNGQSNIATNFPFSTPQLVQGVSNARSVSAGYLFTCASLADASVKCWGQNEFGKLGHPTHVKGKKVVQPFSAVPLSVDLGPGAALNYAVVSAGRDHACASGTFGGFHPATNTATPMGLVVKCWGSNSFGQLTDGTTNASTRPVP